MLRSLEETFGREVDFFYAAPMSTIPLFRGDPGSRGSATLVALKIDHEVVSGVRFGGCRNLARLCYLGSGTTR
jgi:hypothetical protein